MKIYAPKGARGERMFHRMLSRRIEDAAPRLAPRLWDGLKARGRTAIVIIWDQRCNKLRMEAR